MSSPAPLAISLGDPAGVGPELIAAAWARRDVERLPPFFVVEGKGLLPEAAASRGLKVPIAPIADPAEALAEFERTESNEDSGDGEPITLGGRIVSRRHMGKTLFAHIRDGHGQLQLYIRKDELGEETYNQALKLFDLGDWVQATGELFRTKTGEVSLRTTELQMLSKALNAPPEKWHGLQDKEIR